MKIRKGFVSNSSSSSFIVIGEKPIVHSFEIKNDLKKIIVEKLNLPKNKKIWLTEYISDCHDNYSLLYDKGSSLYDNGSFVGPYCTEDYFEITDNIWIKNEHLSKKQSDTNETLNNIQNNLDNLIDYFEKLRELIQ